MNYIEVSFSVEPGFSDILMAELAQVGYESFVETPEGLQAYVAEGVFEKEPLNQLIEKYGERIGDAYQARTIQQRNWNLEWEQGYQPIRIGNQCVVRASFHPAEPEVPYQIVINPKMSFGTGHHETTRLMLLHQLEIDHHAKRVLDVGCGTGILSVMAALRGAAQVDALDTEEWAVENARENALLNNCTHIETRLGTLAGSGFDNQYHIILANISRNVLLAEVPLYARRLAEGGRLVLSGFYEHDFDEVAGVARHHGLSKESQRSENGWTSVVFVPKPGTTPF